MPANHFKAHSDLRERGPILTQRKEKRGMKYAVGKYFVEPILRRLGSMLAVWLMAGGHDEIIVNQFVTALVAAILIGIDLLMAYVHDRINREGP